MQTSLLFFDKKSNIQFIKTFLMENTFFYRLKLINNDKTGAEINVKALHILN